MPRGLVITLVASAVLTLWCWFFLWRGSDRLLAKLFWSLVAAVPVIGPVLYGGLHHAPSSQPEWASGGSFQDGYQDGSGTPGD